MSLEAFPSLPLFRRGWGGPALRGQPVDWVWEAGAALGWARSRGLGSSKPGFMVVGLLPDPAGLGSGEPRRSLGLRDPASAGSLRLLESTGAWCHRSPRGPKEPVAGIVVGGRPEFTEAHWATGVSLALGPR